MDQISWSFLTFSSVPSNKLVVVIVEKKPLWGGGHSVMEVQLFLLKTVINIVTQDNKSSMKDGNDR